MSEGWRLAQGAQQLEETQVTRGAQLYADNCMICHGPVGEGVVGPPLNRPEWGQGTDLELEDTTDWLTKTIQRGRGGEADTTWVHHPDGTIESFTAMPVFGTTDGGPLNEQQVEDLVVFLLKADFSRVTPPEPMLTKPAPDPNRPGETIEVPIEFSDLPLAAGVSDEINDEGRRLMIDRGCVTCHTIGQYGGVQGPNLSDVGNWTTPEFMHEWLTNTENVVPRMPTVWWGNNERKEIDVDWDGIHKSTMPNPITFLGATEDEVAIMVEYLSGLGTE